MDSSSEFADRWVRILADHSVDGVWDKEGCAASVDDLPVPGALRQRLLKWQKWYEIVDGAAPPSIKIDWKAFAAEGLEIARAVKSALPDWTVIYFDEDKADGSWRPGEPRTFEYEIILNPDGSFSP